MDAPAKSKYRTTNWKDYNMALKARGSLLIWLDKDTCWHGDASGKRQAAPPPEIQRGGDPVSPDHQGRFNLALRQVMRAEISAY